MKSCVVRGACVSMMSVLVVACGGGGDSGTPTVVSANPGLAPTAGTAVETTTGAAGAGAGAAGTAVNATPSPTDPAGASNSPPPASGGASPAPPPAQPVPPASTPTVPAEPMPGPGQARFSSLARALDDQAEADVQPLRNGRQVSDSVHVFHSARRITVGAPPAPGMQQSINVSSSEFAFTGAGAVGMIQCNNNNCGVVQTPVTTAAVAVPRKDGLVDLPVQLVWDLGGGNVSEFKAARRAGTDGFELCWTLGGATAQQQSCRAYDLSGAAVGMTLVQTGRAFQ